MAKMKTKPKAAKKKVAKKGAPKARSVKRATPKATAKAKPKAAAKKAPARGGGTRRAGRKGAGDGILGHLEFDNGADEPAAAVVTLNGAQTPPMPQAPANQNVKVDSVSWTSAADSTASEVAANVRGATRGSTLRASNTFNFTQPPLAMIDRLVVSLSAGTLALTAFDANGAQLPIH
jgi:hypothetical protein